ncbi:tetratricopeptide repeat protein [Pelosinus fermentans]|uniref:Tetratricopeptide repeat-containing protein n=1 Tax=Pelosinus fermentans JBW45 TaxID=1192197 RepID=I9NLY6_9FIRM|nr:tetratricopeptide repeat protein [Pelosinus fermentans]AJQ29782.1 Tetratricopeptide repeat-containing protein [Pelosinus fermentans JBW45]
MNAELCFSQGLALAHEGDALQALELFHQAISLKPDYAEAYNGIGALLININNLNEAEFYLQRALELKADYAEALFNLGTLFSRTSFLEEAEICLRETISHEPGFPEAHFRLGMVLKQMERLDEAENHLELAIRLRSDFKEAEFALGVLYLLQGQYEKGWRGYELRRKIFNACDSECTHRKVEELIGEKIVLFHEQGFGDTIHFVRYAQEIEKVASEVVLFLPKQLERLMSASFENIIIQTDEKMVGEYKFSCPLPSLPYMFHTTLDTIPSPIPYIKADSNLINNWSEILKKEIKDQSFTIGVVWAGNPNHKNDKNRSIPFHVFKQLFSLQEVTWVSLQMDEKAADLQTVSHQVIDFHENISDFAETAGLIENLDLIITVDTAVAHLAGAMGKETWLLLSVDPDWRWQEKGQESLWYPTIRIFRQNHRGDWQDVLARVKTNLEVRLKNNNNFNKIKDN